jgi:hypothetical protein
MPAATLAFGKFTVHGLLAPVTFVTAESTTVGEAT